MRDLFRKMTRYAPDTGAEGGSEPTTAPAAPADTSYSDQFGSASEEAGSDKPLDLDKIKPLYEPIDLEEGEPQVIPEDNEVKPEGEEGSTEQAEQPPAAKPEPEKNYDQLKAEYEEYKKSEEQRFNQYYANLKSQEEAKHALANSVETLFNDEKFKKEVEAVETGADLAKLTMKKTVEIADQMLKTKLAPLYELAKSVQKAEEDRKVNEVFNSFRGKYKEEADRALTPGTPENKALITKCQANPALSLEEAFLLTRPQFAKQQIQSEVKKVIGEKRSMAIAPSSGKTTAANTSKIETPRDAMIAAIKELKNRNRQD